MNSPLPNFSAPPLDLRLKRRERSLLAAGVPDEAAVASGGRLWLEAEWQALHEREENLRAYEAQLRAMQADIDARREPEASTSVSPFPAGELSLQTAWDKLIRARELLDAEQVHSRDDRLVLKAELADLNRRQANLATRETSVAAREEQLAAPEPAVAEPIAGQHTMSVMTRLTRSPIALARSVLRGGK
ncbi:MAG: hypothetical protein H7343_19305 [Undibacterium sp.]|nr:hypothetical protein [Opitutaceae bacterium]